MDPGLSQRVGVHLRSNVVGYAALFVALTLGPAWAAKNTAPKNTVNSKSIVNNSVAGKDVKESTLTGVPGANGGTVTQVDTGSGLSGGPITNSGSISLNACPADQVLKSTGGGYACGNDADSGGDITQVTVGSGLTGGGASGALDVGLADCPATQLLQSTGGGNWVCSSNQWGNAIDPGNNVTTTPDVSGVGLLYAAPGGATVVTQLTGGVNGQIVTVVAGNSNVDINDGGNFALSANWTPSADDTLALVHYLGAWAEVARSTN